MLVKCLLDLLQNKVYCFNNESKYISENIENIQDNIKLSENYSKLPELEITENSETLNLNGTELNIIWKLGV